MFAAGQPTSSPEYSKDRVEIWIAVHPQISKAILEFWRQASSASSLQKETEILRGDPFLAVLRKVSGLGEADTNRGNAAV
jgi:hypothetical protein